MNPKHFRWIFLSLLAGLVLVAYSLDAPITIGLTGESSGDKYLIAGGTAPWALCFAALMIALYFLLMNSLSANHGRTILGWWRRFVAFWLDFILAMMSISPILGLLPVLSEWKRTGIFAWSFERTSPAAGDGFLFAAMFAIAIPALALYYLCPLVRGRPSPGACIMGYQIVADNGSTLTLRAALKRALWSFSFLRDWREKSLRIDEETETHAVELE